MYRVAFNPSLPVVVSVPEVRIGEVRLASGDAVPWRQLGMSEQTLFELWRAGMVSFLEEPPAEVDGATEPTDELADEPDAASENELAAPEAAATRAASESPPPAPRPSKRRRS